MHPRGGRKGKPFPADDLARFAYERRAFDDAEIRDRLALAMVAEAARCLEEGVVAGPAELDLATVLGTGFAPFRGGVLRYADARGLRAVAERLRELAALPDVAARPGGRERFAPFGQFRLAEPRRIRDTAARPSGNAGRRLACARVRR